MKRNLVPTTNFIIDDVDDKSQILLIIQQTNKHVPPGVSSRASSVPPARPAVHALVHVAFAGLSVALLAHVAPWSSGHARTSGALHHGPPSRVGSGTHHPSTQTLTDTETHVFLISDTNLIKRLNS